MPVAVQFSLLLQLLHQRDLNPGISGNFCQTKKGAQISWSEKQSPGFQLIIFLGLCLCLFASDSSNLTCFGSLLSLIFDETICLSWPWSGEQGRLLDLIPGQPWPFSPAKQNGSCLSGYLNLWIKSCCCFDFICRRFPVWKPASLGPHFWHGAGNGAHCLAKPSSYWREQLLGTPAM